MAKDTIVIKKALRRYKGRTVDTGPGLTEQAHKEETDMNYILRDYVKTGLLRHAKEHQGKYDDIAVQDFQEAMNIVATARSMFEELPSQVRARFGQDPARFLDFVQNPNNADEMHALGILRGNDGIDITGAVSPAPVKKSETVAFDDPERVARQEAGLPPDGKPIAKEPPKSGA